MATETVYADRNGVVIEPGQTLRVQHCVGPYGQTRIYEGKLEGIDQYHGLSLIALTTLPPFRMRQGNYTIEVRPGERFYLAGSWSVEGSTMIGQHKHDDFEHGHETWVEVAK